MPTLDVYSKQEVDALLAERDRHFTQLLAAYVTSEDKWLRTEDALEASGVKSRETLVKYKRASRPNTQEPGRITYRMQGRLCQYLKSSCIDYAQRKLGQSALAA